VLLSNRFTVDSSPDWGFNEINTLPDSPGYLYKSSGTFISSWHRDD